ncbi:hypothetical protein KIN20_028536 [Parelaphostrongylus tenuis]|uniref:Uncharacterized protein n=1 Tax=Parelaphostrongylus tenuis TaxID=148309 RepID=A0AAD5WES3_PARTN|nr:hypothetical protein KIN20_028536 [Parelaphostrongylus tenuis]
MAVLQLQLTGHKKITVINCYSSADTADEQELDALYYQLGEVICHDESNYKFIVGNFTTRIGKVNEDGYTIKKLRLRERNENGYRFKGFLSPPRPFYGKLLFQNRAPLLDMRVTQWCDKCGD